MQSPTDFARNLITVEIDAASRGSAGLAFPTDRRPSRRIGRVALQARPRSADRTQSPAAVSQKREFFKCRPETIGYFALRLPRIGAWRLVANSQKSPFAGLSASIGDISSDRRTAWLE
jgi:hypothetical protein